MIEAPDHFLLQRDITSFEDPVRLEERGVDDLVLTFRRVLAAEDSAAGPSVRRRSRGRSSAGKSFIRGD